MSLSERAFLAAGLIAAFSVAAVAQQPLVPVVWNQEIAVGDIVVARENGTLQNGDDVTNVRKGAQLRVIALNGDWVGCSGVVDGRPAKGWIKRQVLVKRIQPSPREGSSEHPSDTNDVFVDKESGLMWQVNAAQDLSWAEADSYCGKLNLGGFQDWRLPTETELFSLYKSLGLDKGHSRKDVESTPLNWPTNLYWSSNCNVFGNVGWSAKGMMFFTWQPERESWVGNAEWYQKAAKLGVRAVRTVTATSQPKGIQPNQPDVPKATASDAPASQPMIELRLDNKITLKLVRIESGKFVMGSPPAEKSHTNAEVQHEVTISKPFYMGLTHVTVDQFTSFVDDTNYKTDAEKEGSSEGVAVKDGKPGVMLNVAPVPWRQPPPRFAQKGDHPVVYVSWNDAKAFCDWLSKKTNMVVRLPTEAQWEYACRAGSQTAYYWGNDASDGRGYANCADLSLNRVFYAVSADNFFPWDDGFVYTSPVGRFRANAFGLYDMIGNALQWCEDYAGNYASGAVVDPSGPRHGGGHVLRGGSWSSGPAEAWCANRYVNSPNHRTDNIGFRVCAEPH
jgi:formylglycine-generating enzyme